MASSKEWLVDVPPILLSDVRKSALRRLPKLVLNDGNDDINFDENCTEKPKSSKQHSSLPWKEFYIINNEANIELENDAVKQNLPSPSNSPDYIIYTETPSPVNCIPNHQSTDDAWQIDDVDEPSLLTPVSFESSSIPKLPPIATRISPTLSPRHDESQMIVRSRQPFIPRQTQRRLSPHQTTTGPPIQLNNELQSTSAQVNLLVPNQYLAPSGNNNARLRNAKCNEDIRAQFVNNRSKRGTKSQEDIGRVSPILHLQPNKQYSQIPHRYLASKPNTSHPYDDNLQKLSSTHFNILIRPNQLSVAPADTILRYDKSDEELSALLVDKTSRKDQEDIKSFSNNGGLTCTNMLKLTPAAGNTAVTHKDYRNEIATKRANIRERYSRLRMVRKVPKNEEDPVTKERPVENIVAEDDDEPPPDDDEEITPEEKEKEKQMVLQQIRKEDESYIVNFNPDKKTKDIINRIRGGVINTLEHLTDEIRDEYDVFLNEVDAITYYVHRQAEELLHDYSPRTVVVISSSVPKAEKLQLALQPNVLSLIYDVSVETYESLLDKIKCLLDGYMPGAKAKYLAVVCKGGPGYMYLLQKKPITPVKLLKNHDLLRFWKDLGSLMSKVSLQDPSIVHLMESNVAGNKQGVELISDLESVMYSHKVKVYSPLEMEKRGKEMISTYFFPEKFKMWKYSRYTKIKLYK